MIYLLDTLAVVAGYLSGSVSFAIVICRAFDLPDPRTRGSGNPGATNVARAGDRRAAVLILCGDVLKVTLPMLLARAAGLAESTVGVVGFAAFLGHLYPLYYGFRGGKGVASFGGMLVVMYWQAAVVWGLAWLLVAAVFRYVSVASMTAGVIAVLYITVVAEQPRWAIALSGIAVLLIVFRHRDNLCKLKVGGESRIGE